MRFSLFKVGTITKIDGPIQAYLVQLDDGTNVLIDPAVLGRWSGTAPRPSPSLPRITSSRG